MSLSKTLYPLLITGSTQEDPSTHDLKIVDWDIIKTNKLLVGYHSISADNNADNICHE